MSHCCQESTDSLQSHGASCSRFHTHCAVIQLCIIFHTGSKVESRTGSSLRRLIINIFQFNGQCLLQFCDTAVPLKCKTSWNEQFVWCQWCRVCSSWCGREQTAVVFMLWWRMNLSFLVICSAAFLFGATWLILQLLIGKDALHYVFLNYLR